MEHVLKHLEVRYGHSLECRNTRRFCCADCGKSYERKKSLMNHIRGHLGVEYHCDLCGQQFLWKHTLRMHKQSHHGPNGSLMQLPDRSRHFCPHCPKRTRKLADSESLLKAHITICRLEQPFACGGCQLRFRQKNAVAVHQQAVHQKVRFICAECGQSFRSKSTLAAHCMKHLGLKPFKCSDCQKQFSNESSRDQHQLTHGAIKPFNCADCSESYIWKQNLVRHVLKHLEIRCGSSLKQKNT